jgi:hypothetical protein
VAHLGNPAPASHADTACRVCGRGYHPLLSPLCDQTYDLERDQSLVKALSPIALVKKAMGTSDPGAGAEVLALIGVLVFCSAIVQAQLPGSTGYPWVYEASMRGRLSLPPVETDARGTSTIILWNATYGEVYFWNEDIQDAFASHVHLGNSSTNGAILVPVMNLLTPSGQRAYFTGAWSSITSFNPSEIMGLADTLNQGNA